MFRSNIPAMAVLCAALLATACANTVRGVGQDAANTVNATQSAANNVANAVE